MIYYYEYALLGNHVCMHKLAFILLVIGGLNWLLVGLFGWDISRYLGGMDALLPKIIYILVGIAAVYELFSHKSRCKHCEVKPAAGTM